MTHASCNESTIGDPRCSWLIACVTSIVNRSWDLWSTFSIIYLQNIIRSILKLAHIGYIKCISRRYNLLVDKVDSLRIDQNFSTRPQWFESDSRVVRYRAMILWITGNKSIGPHSNTTFQLFILLFLFHRYRFVNSEYL